MYMNINYIEHVFQFTEEPMSAFRLENEWLCIIWSAKILLNIKKSKIYSI